MSKDGILLIDKALHSTSFHLVSLLRKITRVDTIGHAGTLDPAATGVMVMLIGRAYTKKSNLFLGEDKQYRAEVRLGVATDSFDAEGQVTHRSDVVVSASQLQRALDSFQGNILQVPPMFCAKKIGGKKLYDLARKGITVERKPVSVRLHISLVRYEYPEVTLLIDCSKGTYIRSLAHDLGQALGCGAHLASLIRTRSGSFTLQECIPQEVLHDPQWDIAPHLRHL